MKVKCSNTGGEALLAADIASGNTRSSDFYVTLVREYIVYGVAFSSRAVVSYLIQADTGFPQWTPASLFDVVCGRVSRYWILVNWPTSGKYFTVITFPEFVQSQEQHDRLAEGDDLARAMFFRRKQLADLEFLDPSVQEWAVALEDKWLQCPFCSDAWKSGCLDAMVRCPTCERVSRNPKCLSECSEDTIQEP